MILKIQFNPKNLFRILSKKSLAKYCYALTTEKRCTYCFKNYYANASSFFGLCQYCSLLVKQNQNYCKTCGELTIKPENTCEFCKQRNIPWKALKVYGIYSGLLKHLIIHSKFHENLIYTQTLGSLLIPLAQTFPKADFILPMPLHRKRLFQRGYNQCAEIAKPLGKSLDIPILSHALKRVEYTKAQTTLTRAERLTNLIHCFQANRTLVKGKTIILLDDVSTTGSSLFYATSALLKEGATAVFVLYVASTPREKI